MDSCGQCLDYFCGGPRPNRERFRPWKKKSRAMLEAEEQARKEKKRAKARKHRKNNAPRTQKAARPSHQHASQRDQITVASPAPPAVNEVTLDRHRESQQVGAGQVFTSQLQARIDQLRRQLDDSVIARHKAEAERDALEKKFDELPHESRISQERQTRTGTAFYFTHPRGH
ncbi:hypothetical protein BS17DRAFT_183574 [Gyrodon lividus]|nr:hypothetical protein BS17DRAFT_183574 [Gyrodon lividus]